MNSELLRMGDFRHHIFYIVFISYSRHQVKKLEDEVRRFKDKECELLQENRNLRAELATQGQLVG